jgi:hypothetical protein
MNVEQAREVFHAAHEWHTKPVCPAGILAFAGRWSVSVCAFCFMWYQKVKVSCVVVFRDEGTFEPTTGVLSRENRTNPLTWEVM